MYSFLCDNRVSSLYKYASTVIYSRPCGIPVGSESEILPEKSPQTRVSRISAVPLSIILKVISFKVFS